MKLNRRDFLKAAGGASLLPLASRVLAARPRRSLITKAIPSSGERVPVIGIGTREYRTQGGDMAAFRETLRVFSEAGGTVIDTAPSYGDSESVLGSLIAELGIRDRLFLATKCDRTGVEEGKAGMRRSLEYLGTDRVDVMQVHNLRDVDTQLSTLREFKQAGIVRYYGVTTSSDRQYESMQAVASSQDLDFMQVDYALGNRNAADDLLPLALDRGIAVLVNLPFGRGGAFRRVGERALPEWAAEVGIESWAQFFLKYVVSHPAVTAAIPGTTKPHHATDNVGAMTGELPDETLRRRMEAFYDALPDPG